MTRGYVYYRPGGTGSDLPAGDPKEGPARKERKLSTFALVEVSYYEELISPLGGSS
jgi:hypothetical protein